MTLKRLPLALLVFLFGLLLATAAVAQSPTPPFQLQITPVVPEPFPFSDRYPAQVALNSPDELAQLTDLRIDVGDVQPADGTRSPAGAAFEPMIATIYINDAEANQLAARGLQAIAIPNESLRTFYTSGPGTHVPNAWPTFDQFVARMQTLAGNYPNFVRLISIGKSVQNRDLWCLKLSDNPDSEEDEPEFRYVSTMHGNEGVGTEMTLRLAELLMSSYGTDPTLTTYVNEMEIWLCPIYNPDGYVAGSRYNAHGEDLNRDFPDPLDHPDHCGGYVTGCEPETVAFMNFAAERRFVMGANYHTGTLVVNYPWDASGHNPPHSPDNDLYYAFSVGYSSRNPMIWNGPFPNGVTEGWQWYTVYGGLQDYSYVWHGEHHVTIEISNYQPGDYGQMGTYWDANRPAMLWWMGRALTGVRGRITDAATGEPLEAKIEIVGMLPPNRIHVDPDVGDYHRPLLSGSYSLQVSAACYITQTATLDVISGTVVSHDFALLPNVWTVEGAVTEQGSGRPLTATVELLGTSLVTTTQPLDGAYALQACAGSYTLRVSAPGYQAQERQIVLDHHQVQNFALAPAPCTLVVDDDLGQNYQTYYQNALTAAGINYDTWTVAAKGSPTLANLSGYTRLVWLTGDDFSTSLTSSEQATLAAFLDAGGRLFLSGQSIGFDIGASSFFANYLHASFITADTNTYDLSGLDYLSGTDVYIQGGDGANNQNFPNAIAPLGEAVAILDYPAPYAYGGVAFQNDAYRVVYLSFGFEAIDNAADRQTVMAQSMTWLGGCGALSPNLSASAKQVSTAETLPGDRLVYTLAVANVGGETTAAVTDTLPAEATWTGMISATQGTPAVAGNQLTWQGAIAPGGVITLTYAVTVNQCLPAGTTITNLAAIADDEGSVISRTATTRVVNAVPTAALAISPADLSLGQPLTVTLAWAASADLNCDALVYRLAFGSLNPPPVVISNTTATTFDPGPLQPGVTYYWQVTASDGVSETVSPIWSFSTAYRLYLPAIQTQTLPPRGQQPPSSVRLPDAAWKPDV